MERSTILEPTACDLTSLPLGSLEAFLLSQLDGQLTLEEVAAICSLELDQASKIAARLVDLGAASTRRSPGATRGKREKPGRRATGAAIEEVARTGRRDPRSDDVSLRPPPLKTAPPPAEKVPALVGKRTASAERPAERRRSRDSLRVQRTSSSRRLKATKRTTPPPTRSSRTERPQVSAKQNTTPPAIPSKRPSKRPSKTSPATAAPAKLRAEPSPERVRKLQAAAREIEVQARIETLLSAADEALKTNDVINAANNLRLALQHREDPLVRMKLEEVDRLAKAVRLERTLASARAAEERKRWPEAAMHLARAYETKPTAELADRAASALLLAEGDLERAAQLAEQAVSLEPKNARYRLTLAEVYLESGELVRAAKHAAVALELTPKDPRARDLADAIAQAERGDL